MKKFTVTTKDQWIVYTTDIGVIQTYKHKLSKSTYRSPLRNMLGELTYKSIYGDDYIFTPSLINITINGLNVSL